MKNHKIFWTFIAIAAVSTVITACGSSPRNVPDEALLTVLEVSCSDDINGGGSEGSQAGSIIMPDGESAFYFENGKNVSNGIVSWYMPTFSIQPGNFNGYTRFSFEVAADYAEIIADVYEFGFRVQSTDGSFYDFVRTADWSAYKRQGLITPAIFQTIELNISPGSQTGWGGDSNPLANTSAVWFLLICSDEDVPGRIYFRNLKFLK